jgi:hypothetical protein
MSTKIQTALGRNVQKRHSSILVETATVTATGQAVIDSVRGYVEWSLDHDDGSDLVTSIWSKNLRASALFSARSARIAYVMCKAILLDGEARKAVVRTQLIEYGSVAEAILLDLLQSVGIHNKPLGLRAPKDKWKKSITWNSGGLFAHDASHPKKAKHHCDFVWLITEAERVGAIDAELKRRLHWLRESRNLVHPLIPTGERYANDLDSGRTAKTHVIELRDATMEFKRKHGLPLRAT